MSVLIPVMRMPANCMSCKVESLACCGVWAGSVSASAYKNKRYEGCPLLEMPLHQHLMGDENDWEPTFRFFQD